MSRVANQITAFAIVYYSMILYIYVYIACRGTSSETLKLQTLNIVISN